MKLYSYFRSSAAYRVRIALQIKGLPYDYAPIHLLRQEHTGAAYAAVAPTRLVPTLEVDGDHLAQSMAIIEYLDETHPTPALLPSDPWARAQVRALAQSIACEIHPLNNLGVLTYLVQELKLDEAAKQGWIEHWVRTGLERFERQLDALAVRREAAGLPPSVYCHGDTPTLADCCLVPQIFNAQRFKVDLTGLSRTVAAYEACVQLGSFQRAHPSQCPDGVA